MNVTYANDSLILDSKIYRVVDNVEEKLLTLFVTMVRNRIEINGLITN